MRVRALHVLPVLLALMIQLAACNLGPVPQATPTVAPTRTPSATPPSPTARIQLLPSFTPTATVTATLPPTATATLTPSVTLSPTVVTETATSSATATATLTRTSTVTFTPVPTLTRTPVPSATRLPSLTPLPTIGPTRTPVPTVTPAPSSTPLPSRTPVPTGIPSSVPTRIADLGIVTATPAPTSTYSPTPLPTSPLRPTLDVTPTFVTLDAPTVIPPESLLTPQVDPNIPPQIEPSALPTLAEFPTVIPTSAPTEIVLAPPSGPPGTFAFALTANSGALDFRSFSLPGDTALFARNPADAARYATVDQTGNLYLINPDGSRVRVTFSPFSEFTAATREENKTQVAEIAWSPDGLLIAFRIVSSPAGHVDGNDGVWYAERDRTTSTDPTYQVLRDCLPELRCNLVNNPTNPDNWRSTAMAWSPNSDALLIKVDLPMEGRGGFVISQAVRTSEQATTRPPVLRYDDASWAANGQDVIVSGRAPDGAVVIRRVDRNGNVTQDILNASAFGLWVQNAVERPDGTVLALGSFNGPGTALQLINGSGQAVTQTIGDGAPQRVSWSPDRSAVLVVVNGRYYVASVTGAVSEITASVAGALAVEWVSGNLP